jgi:hypothetical protein
VVKSERILSNTIEVRLLGNAAIGP